MLLFFRKIPSKRKKISYAGLLWYLIFIIPALPQMMRWYVFTASVGFTFIFALYLEQIINGRRVIIGIVLLLFVVCIYSDLSRMLIWKDSGDKMNRIVESLKPYKGKAYFVLWCVPDKYDGVPLMKLGISQTLGYSVSNRNADADSPLRCELFSANSCLNYKSPNDSTLVFDLYDGRFKSNYGRSSSVIKTEYFLFSDNGYTIEINNGVMGSKFSEAKVTVPRNLKDKVNLFYDGNRLLNIKE